MELPLIIDSLLSGTIQGVTELLPISSTGHLLLLSAFTGTSLALSDIAVLHLGTLGSILIAMRDKMKFLFSPRFLIAVLIASVPAGIVGFLFEESLDSMFGSTPSIAISLALWGGVMIATDRWAKQREFKTTSLSEISPYQAAAVGAAQMIALIPGTSRSGITTIAGILSGMSPSTALAFSFVSGIPLLAGSGLYGLYKSISTPADESGNFAMIALATLIAAVVGIFAAQILKKRITKGILTICGIYRIVLSIALAATFLL